ncbi:MAG: PmoA family protein [Planctomycetota bacterium]
MPSPALPACQIVPLPDHRVAVDIKGTERLRWHFGDQYPRPFFYPLVGPSGASLIRMGHPGAPNHDHHRGIWFAHHDVLGNDFWSDRTPARIRQIQWLCYEDGDAEARLAVKLGWYDGHDARALLEQEVIAAIQPGEAGETLLEIQTTFIPTSQQLEFGQTNFGFLGVRVAKSLSVHFGNGRIRDSEEREGESEIFGKQAAWLDYSGAVANRENPSEEGITYLDHPDNPGYPSRWHVREDGWMIASACMRAARITSRHSPLTLRYLLHAHGGPLQRDRARALAASFADRGPLQVNNSRKKHVAHETKRVGKNG